MLFTLMHASVNDCSKKLGTPGSSDMKCLQSRAMKSLGALFPEHCFHERKFAIACLADLKDEKKMKRMKNTNNILKPTSSC